MATPGLFSILSLPVLSTHTPTPTLRWEEEGKLVKVTFLLPISRMNRSFAFGALASMNYREGLALAHYPCVPHRPFRASTLPSPYGVSYSPPAPLIFIPSVPSPGPGGLSSGHACFHLLLESLQSCCLALIFRSLLLIGVYH